jgi:hypothetical protein
MCRVKRIDSLEISENDGEYSSGGGARTVYRARDGNIATSCYSDLKLDVYLWPFWDKIPKNLMQRD